MPVIFCLLKLLTVLQIENIGIDSVSTTHTFSC